MPENMVVMSVKVPARYRDFIRTFAGFEGLSVSQFLFDVIRKEIFRRRKRLAPESGYQDMFVYLEECGLMQEFRPSEIFSIFQGEGKTVYESSYGEIEDKLREILTIRKGAELHEEMKALMEK